MLNPPSLEVRAVLAGEDCNLAVCHLTHTVHTPPTLCIIRVRRKWHFSRETAWSECQNTATQHQQKSSKINGPPFIFWAQTYSHTVLLKSWQSFPSHLLSLHASVFLPREYAEHLQWTNLSRKREPWKITTINQCICICWVNTESKSEDFAVCILQCFRLLFICNLSCLWEDWMWQIKACQCRLYKSGRPELYVWTL